jgi:hypothetical protein
MKKITKSDLKGLTEAFPLYEEEAMRKVVGGLEEKSVTRETLNKMQRIEATNTQMTLVTILILLLTMVNE